MALSIGQDAPDFTLNSNTNEQITLSSYRGKQYVLFAFFPAAFTGG